MNGQTKRNKNNAKRYLSSLETDIIHESLKTSIRSTSKVAHLKINYIFGFHDSKTHPDFFLAPYHKLDDEILIAELEMIKTIITGSTFGSNRPGIDDLFISYNGDEKKGLETYDNVFLALENSIQQVTNYGDFDLTNLQAKKSETKKLKESLENVPKTLSLFSKKLFAMSSKKKELIKEEEEKEELEPESKTDILEEVLKVDSISTAEVEKDFYSEESLFDEEKDPDADTFVEETPEENQETTNEMSTGEEIFTDETLTTQETTENSEASDQEFFEEVVESDDITEEDTEVIENQEGGNTDSNN